MKTLSNGETRLLFRLLAEEHEASEDAVREADERLSTAREQWERATEAPKDSPG